MAGGYGRGLAYMREQAAAAGNYGPRMKKLWVSVGEVAKFWFLQEPDDIIVPLVHQMLIQPKRPGAKPWNKDVLCLRRSLQDPAERCPRCAAGEPGPWPRSVTPVWVEAVIHASPAPAGAPAWTPVPRQGLEGTFYREDAHELYLLIMKGSLVEQVLAAYEGISDAFDETPQATSTSRTILNRPFTIKRLSIGSNKTQDTIAPLGPATAPPEVVELRTTGAPDYEAIIDAEFGEGKRQSPTSGTAVINEPAGRTADDYFVAAPGVSTGSVAPALDDDELVSF